MNRAYYDALLRASDAAFAKACAALTPEEREKRRAEYLVLGMSHEQADRLVTGLRPPRADAAGPDLAGALHPAAKTPLS